MRDDHHEALPEGPAPAPDDLVPSGDSPKPHGDKLAALRRPVEIVEGGEPPANSPKPHGDPLLEAVSRPPKP